jgi:hypothetical protein
MSHVPRALLAYANDSPSGDRLGDVSSPEASVSCVNAVQLPASAPPRRPSHHPVASSSRPARIAAPARRRFRGGGAGRTAPGADGRLPLHQPSANFAVLDHRSAGSLASALSTAASTAAGTVSRTVLGGWGRSVSTLATTAWVVAPVNGGSPVSIS